MKFISYIHQGRESFGVVSDDSVTDLREQTGLATLAEYIGSPGYAARNALDLTGSAVKLADVELLPPIPQPEKIVCAVRNYMDHHNEAVASGMKREISDFPPIFLRVWRSQTAHEQPIIRPNVSESLDWEGELAVVIGQGGRNISEDDAASHIAGYSCYNDASIREWQFHAKQIAAGKNFEKTGGFGPWLVSADEIDLNRPLGIETRVNDETVQSGDTSHLIFSIPRLISYASTIFTLTAGDVLVTGTPAGVGFSRNPPRFMKPGDTVEVEIEGIGTLRNPVVQQEA